MTNKSKDIPIAECMAKAAPLILAGATIHQKFTCSSCGSRQTIPDPNVWYAHGMCEACGAETDIEKQGCGYLLLMDLGGEQ